MYFKSFFDNLGTQNPLKTARKRQNRCTNRDNKVSKEYNGIDGNDKGRKNRKKL